MKACLLVVVLAATAIAAPKKTIVQIYELAQHEKLPAGAKVDVKNGFIEIATKENPTELYALWVTAGGSYVLGTSTLEGHASNWWRSDGVTVTPVDAGELLPRVELVDLVPKHAELVGDAGFLIDMPRSGTTIHARLDEDSLSKLSPEAKKVALRHVDFVWDAKRGAFGVGKKSR